MVVYLPSEMKLLTSIAFATLLSTLLLVETIGVYITKDICNPCGTSAVSLEMVSVSDDHKACDHHHNDNHAHEASSCCDNHAHHIPHGEDGEDHEHHQEHQYLNQAPTFFNTIISMDFTVYEMAVLTPLLNITIDSQENTSLDYGNPPPPLIVQMDSYCSYLCTYLI